MDQENWFKEEFERARQRNTDLPPYARMIVTSPLLSAHSRSVAPVEQDVAATPDHA